MSASQRKDFPKARYLVIRLRGDSKKTMSLDEAVRLDKAVGLATIPNAYFVNYINSGSYKSSDLYVQDVSESEYTSYQTLELFPEYKWHRPHGPGAMASLYDPELYTVVNDRIVE